MLSIRLKRVGRKNDPSFRIIVQDHRRSPKKTRGVAELVGSYDARKGTPQINGERVKYWISQGAQPSDTVRNLLIDAKIIEGKKVNALNKKTPVVKEKAPEPVKKVVAPVAVAVAVPVAETPVVAEVVPVVEVPTCVVEVPVVEAPVVEETAPVVVEETPVVVEKAPAA